jgi:flagellar biosynthesis protein FlhF
LDIQRFCAADSRSAIAQVRKVLGPEALIIANRRVADGVEITAARNVDVLAPVTNAAVVNRQSGPSGRGLSADSMERLHADLLGLRDLLQQQLQRYGDLMAAQPPSRIDAVIQQRLLRMGFRLKRVRQLLPRNVPSGNAKQAWARVLSALMKALSADTAKLQGPQRVVALVGMSGVGKSLTATKLLARLHAQKPGARLGCIALTGEGFVADAGLSTYARSIGVKLRAVQDSDTLNESLRQMAGCERVIIDTAGYSQRDPYWLKQFAALQNVREPVQRYLVVSAVSDPRQSHELLFALGSSRISGVIITKLDEAIALGAHLDFLLSSRLPAAFVSRGRCVLDDLEPASAGLLVREAERLRRQQSERMASARAASAFREGTA